MNEYGAIEPPDDQFVAVPEMGERGKVCFGATGQIAKDPRAPRRLEGIERKRERSWSSVLTQA